MWFQHLFFCKVPLNREGAAGSRRAALMLTSLKQQLATAEPACRAPRRAPSRMRQLPLLLFSAFDRLR